MVKDPTFLMVNDISIYWHGLLMMAALAAGMTLSYRLRKKQTGQSGKEMLVAYIIALPAALVGARAFFCWCKPEDFYELSQAFDFSNGGFSILGAIVGASVGFVIAAIVQRVRAGEMLDVCTPGLGLAIAVGRWAAAFTGENLGGIVTSEAFQWLPFAMYSYDEDLYRRPFFAAGSFIAVLLTLMTLWLFSQRYIKGTLKNRSGDIYMLFIVMYFSLQGIYEQYRWDPLYFNTPFLAKLQTVSATLCIGGLLAAMPLAVMILRGMFFRGFRADYLVYIPFCAVLYLGYFNIVLRIESVNETLNGAVLVLCAVGLSLVAVKLFADAAQFNEKALFSPVSRLISKIRNGGSGRNYNAGRNNRSGSMYRW